MLYTNRQDMNNNIFIQTGDVKCHESYRNPHTDSQMQRSSLQVEYRILGYELCDCEM